MDLIIGVDGGQSSTRCVITDLDCNLLVQTKGGPSNHLTGSRGISRLEKALNQSLLAALKQKPEEARIKAICLGMTGIADKSQSRQIVEAKVRKMVEPEVLKVFGDTEIIFMGATAGKSGIVAYAGTGSTAIGKNEEGRVARCGRWGYIVDDEGGGYAIGRRCLQAAFRAADGYGPSTSLTGRVLEYFNSKSWREINQKIYRGDGLPRFKIADLSRLVSKEAVAGDQVARKILSKASVSLGQLVLCVSRKLQITNDSFMYTILGGVLQGGDLIKETFIETVTRQAPAACFSEPLCKPIAGALIICLSELGYPINQQRLDKLIAL